MNRAEAKHAIEAGKKVTHEYFTAEEWVSYYDNHVYIMEDGVMVHEVLFWADRQAVFFDDGWEIWQDPAQEIN
jgi:hypothetical protein